MQSGTNGSRTRSLGEDFDAVLAAARAGRPEAWERLYRSLAPAVTGYLRVQGAAEPDDLASEAFLGVFRRIGSFSGDEAGFRSWVFVIAHRRLQDDRRRSSRRPVMDDSFDESVSTAIGREHRSGELAGGNVEDDALASISNERVKRVCARLAPDQADVLLLRILGDLTVDQVAHVLGKTPGAVKALQRRGFEAVRKILSAEGVPL